jgi:diguanylate cyclase (GGDEF)-like protein
MQNFLIETVIAALLVFLVLLLLRGRSARLALARDMRERDHMASQLMYQVQHDLLTGLPNRSTFLKRLHETFDSVQNGGSGCAVLVLHISRLEKINEHYGHDVGDGLLKEVARLLQSKLRAPDAIGRTGSREYMIVLASVSNGDAAEVKARDLLRIFDEPIMIGDHRIAVSASMGVAAFPEDSDNVNTLLRDAARAQARARVRGTDHFVRFFRKLSIEAQEESRIECLVQQALSSDGFEVFYQPLLDTKGELCGLEALLRLHDVDGTLISANMVIPIAESTGAIAAVGRWVVGEVCRQLKEWKDSGLHVVPIAINVSALQIVQPNFCPDILSILSQFNIAPELIHLELTESSVMPQDSLALDNMLKLSTEGIRFSIDDFGTGYSSLDRLHQLPVSILKIDQSFVKRMLDPNGTLPIVTTIISMAHSLNVGVVAEGVESKEQFHALYEMGCDQFQGFFFSKPMNASVTATLFSGEHAFLPAEVSAVTAKIASLPLRLFPPAPSGPHLW